MGSSLPASEMLHRSRHSKGWTAITSARLEFSFEIDIHCAMITSAELIDRLASRDVVARTAAADELYGLGTAAVPPMIEALRCRWVRPSPQYALLWDTLARLGRVAFAPVRDALAGARTEEERRTFARVFSDLGESALPDFIDALQDPRTEISLGAI